MAKYKIVHLITSLKIGGAETVLYDLVRKLDNDLFENHIIFFHDGPNAQRLRMAGFNTYQIKGLFCKYDPIFLFRLFKLIRKIKPDCIHASLWSANILGTIFARIFKIPIVCVLHLATNFESSGKNSFFRTNLDKIILPMATKIVAVSDDMVKDLKKELNWFPFEKLKVIKNGIDIDCAWHTSKANIKRSDLFPALNYPNEQFIVGSVGRFIPRKNHQLLIESFALLCKDFQDARLILIGYGPLEDFLRDYTKRLKIENKVIFIKTDKALDYYKILDCFVLSSINESFGLVLLEAMLFKIPCIVTNDDNKNEIIANGINGYISGRNNISLYNAIRYLYINRKEARQIGENAYQNVIKNFNLENTSKNYGDLFLQLCQSNKKN